MIYRPVTRMIVWFKNINLSYKSSIDYDNTNNKIFAKKKKKYYIKKSLALKNDLFYFFMCIMNFN